jgi:hypothetical protein
MQNQNNISQTQVRASTYSMLVRSEEKGRNAFEMLASMLLIGSVAVAVWLVAHQPVGVPSEKPTSSVMTAQAADSQAQGI